MIGQNVRYEGQTPGTTDGGQAIMLKARANKQTRAEATQAADITDFVVSSIRLKNVKSKATLDLNAVPKDTDPFPYPTDNATIASDGYQTHWVPDATPTVVDLEANITNTTVAG